MNLHCSQTIAFANAPSNVWYSYEFTLLSNTKFFVYAHAQFDIPMNLHCSQTCWLFCVLLIGLIFLWIYTALKQSDCLITAIHCLIFLWIYTALKHKSNGNYSIDSFIFLWIYTALKRWICSAGRYSGLIFLWIYTALKHA